MNRNQNRSGSNRYEFESLAGWILKSSVHLSTPPALKEILWKTLLASRKKRLSRRVIDAKTDQNRGSHIYHRVCCSVALISCSKANASRGRVVYGFLFPDCEQDLKNEAMKRGEKCGEVQHRCSSEEWKTLKLQLTKQATVVACKRSACLSLVLVPRPSALRSVERTTYCSDLMGSCKLGHLCCDSSRHLQECSRVRAGKCPPKCFVSDFGHLAPSAPRSAF